jgi:hypothetical protein
VYRYIREALDLLAAMAPTLEQAIEVARRKAFVILDGTLLRIDRVGMASATTAPSVESARSAVPVLPPVRFSVPLAEPGVRLSPHRALHGLCLQAWLRLQGVGIVLPR